MDDGIGHKIGLFIQAMTTVIIGFVMGFAYGWKLTLVIIAVSPLLVIAGLDRKGNQLSRRAVCHFPHSRAHIVIRRVSSC